jgi:aldehyde dehydrogenase (NAD+)
MKAAAENLSSVTLELGGQNPAIIHESASLEDAAEKLVWSKCMNTGQSCMAPNTIYIPANLKAEFIQLARSSFYKYYGDGSLVNNADFGRIISKGHASRLEDLISEAIENGAEAFLADKLNPDEKFIPFSMLWNIHAEAKVLNEEIFGPVMTIQTYDDPDSLSELLWPQKPLATYIFSKDKIFVKNILRATISGTACINDTTLPFVYPGLPFGGIQQSGIGKAHGFAGFQAFTNYRPVVYQRTGITPLKFIYPPFNRISKGMVDLFVKWL